DFIDASFRIHGFIYDGRSFTRLDYPGADATSAYKVNNAGQVVGYYRDSAFLPHGFSYFGGRFTPIRFPGSIDNTSAARGIDSRGDIVGAYDFTVEITHGFIYQDGQYRTLDTPFAQNTQVTEVNDFGQAVGFVSDDWFNGPILGFLLDRNGFTQF